MTFFSVHGQDGALAAQDGHVPAAEQVVHVESRELCTLAGRQELGRETRRRRRRHCIDRGDAADPGVAEDFLFEVLHGVLVHHGVPVHAQEVVEVIAYLGEAAVEGPDLLVLVHADVVDKDHGPVGDVLVGVFVRAGELAGHVKTSRHRNC